MVTLIVFIAGLVGKVANNLAGETQSGAGVAAITNIIATLPGDVATIIVNFIAGLGLG